jgi:hypothetical protein
VETSIDAAIVAKFRSAWRSLRLTDAQHLTAINSYGKYHRLNLQS